VGTGGSVSVGSAVSGTSVAVGDAVSVAVGADSLALGFNASIEAPMQ